MPSVFITGANRGIGFEFACQYANAGWRVHAASRVPRTAGEIAGDVEGHLLEVTDAGQISSLSTRFETERLDLVINNAGIWLPDVETLDTFDTSAWDAYMRVNALGALLVSQALANTFSPDGAKLINISSRSASMTLADDKGFGYGSSKAALNAITKSLSVDFASKLIAVVAITPGWVSTDMGGAEANLTVQESVRGMREVIEGVTMEHSGRFYAYDGQEVPW